MKTNVRFTALALGAIIANLGCGGPPPPEPPPPPPAPAPVTVVAAPAPEPRKSVLVGLPLTGSQIDVLGEIEFDVDKATIRQTPQTLGILTTLANAGRVYPQITRLRVEGHTDSDGNEGHNQQLSDARAREVVRWLVEHGIDPRRLVAVGCGSRDPLVPNSSPENKQRNRRTEFDIEEVEGQPFENATRACEPNGFRGGGRPVAAAGPAPARGRLRVTRNGNALTLPGDVNFQPGKAALVAGEHDVLDALVDFMKENPNVNHMRIEGHTDTDAPGMLELSQERSMAVKSFMVSNGVEARRIVATGCGGKYLLRDASGKVDTARSRRTEATVLEENGKPVSAEPKVRPNCHRD